MMTRKDYVATAEILKTYIDEIDMVTMSNLVDDFCAMFEEDNSNFDSDRFYQAVMDN